MERPASRRVAKRILILEDEYFLADDCAKEVARRGMQAIGPFATTADALQSLRNLQPDGAIIDINLRGDMAFPVAAILKDAGVPFVIYTGYGEVPECFGEVVTVGKAETPEGAVRKLLGCMKQSIAANVSPVASKAHSPSAARRAT